MQGVSLLRTMDPQPLKQLLHLIVPYFSWPKYFSLHQEMHL